MKEEIKILRALGNERRLKMVVLLERSGARTVGELAQAIHLSFRSTSRHLQVLKSAGMVESEQAGLWVRYRLNRSSAILKALLPCIKKL